MINKSVWTDDENGGCFWMKLVGNLSFVASKCQTFFINSLKIRKRQLFPSQFT